MATTLAPNLTREEVSRLHDVLAELDIRRRVALARKDFHVFVEAVFRDQETGEPVRQGRIHKDWFAWVKSHPWAVIMAPRYHAKTVQYALAYPLWRLGNDHDLRIKIVSNSDDNAVKRVRSIREYIEFSPAVRQIFPDLQPDEADWSKTTFKVVREHIGPDPSVEAFGVLSTGTGSRADLVIFDDIVDYRNAIFQPQLREAVKTAFRSQWLNLLSNQAEVVYIATPWHHDDLTAELRADPQWKDRFFERFVDENLTPVWPEKWPRENLVRRLQDIGKREFGRAFQGVAQTDEDALFKAHVIGTGPENPGKIRDYNLAMEDVPRAWPRFTGVDLAIGKGRENDYTVAATVALDMTRNLVVPVSCYRGRFTSPETAKNVEHVYLREMPLLIHVENNAYQAALIEWLQATTTLRGIPIVPFRTGDQKADPMVGLPGLAASMEAGGWKVPLAGHLTDCACGICTWLDELAAYPIGKHDDTIMAFWFAYLAAMAWSLRKRRTEMAPKIQVNDMVKIGELAKW